MDYVNDKFASLTEPALSRLNEYRRKQGLEKLATSNSKGPIRDQSLASGILFGGDSASKTQDYSAPPQPPPIGFNVDLLRAKIQQETGAEDAKDDQARQEPKLAASVDSQSSLYEGDTWSKLWFQRVMLLTLVRLLLFIVKIYEDFHATKDYNKRGNYSYFLISLATLFLPTLIFTIYRISRYLQIELPRRKAITDSSALTPYPAETVTVTKRHKGKSPSDDEDKSLRKALISASPISQQTADQAPAQQPDDDGLVTARQTPTQMEDFQDSKSQQDEETIIDNNKQKTSAKQQPIVKIESEIKETVDVDKLGNLPDKESVRIAIGTSEQFLHGVLFIFWQLKRQVDVVSYLVERSCVWRKPKATEKEDLDRLRTGSDGLEWFQDFYSAFLAVIAQIYATIYFWTNHNQKAGGSNQLLAMGTDKLNQLSADSISDGSISKSAQIISTTLGQQVAATGDMMIMSQLVVSLAVISSLLVAVRRRDDGPLTLALSMLGWGSIFASRIILIALSLAYIKLYIVMIFLTCHVLGITAWIYKIAIDSHNGKKNETVDEAKWDPQDIESSNVQRIELQQQQEPRQQQQVGSNDNGNTSRQANITNQWSFGEHLILLVQIFTLFSIPSIFYWPIMFNLKWHQRPFKYLVLILIENFIMIPTIWSHPTVTDSFRFNLLGAGGAFSIVGFIFIALYIACKPSLTEYFARADELFNEAERSGIYYEFCSRVFKLPDLNKQAFKRLMNQTEEIIEEEEIELAAS